MSDSNTVAWLSEAVASATKSAKFFVAGLWPSADPGIQVEGLGAVKLPLSRGMPKKLIAQCRVAPYGKGTRTLVDTSVRNTFELDPRKFRVSDEWNEAIADVTRHVAQQLGLPAEQLEAKLYKLLVYQQGGFFLKHRDSEKHDRMLASLIVVLPNRFDGGRLIVRHGDVEQAFEFREARQEQAACYAAFFSDCEHEVERVYNGHRLCLTYNLVLKPKRGKGGASVTASGPGGRLAQSIETWIAKQPDSPLVFAFEHHYSKRGLSLDLLKGADRQLAETVVPAADATGCVVHMAQFSRHLCQFADDGSFGGGYSRRRLPPQKIEIGEAYEDELIGDEWADLRGKKQPWGPIPFELASIVSSTPIDQWKPTSEEFEGYTGNAGNTLDRWYHRSAMVVWSREHHFEVVASSGATSTIPLFCSMVKKLARTPKKRFEEARAESVRFARAIIARWPRRWAKHRDYIPKGGVPYGDFADDLLKLHDRETVSLFLSKIALQDQVLPLASFIVAACREFGWSSFAEELRLLLKAPPDGPARDEIPLRDMEWLSAYCCKLPSDAGAAKLARELCLLTIERFCAPRPAQRPYSSPNYRPPASTWESEVPLLVKALLAAGYDKEAARIIAFVSEKPDEFRLKESQVPALKTLIPWSEKQLGKVHPELAAWRSAVRHQLEAAVARKPTPPANWSRPAEVGCTCRYCGQLKTFLADPAAEVGRITAPEADRSHLISTIERRQLDVKHKLDRNGRPFSLVLPKTTDSYERAVKQHESDGRLLGELQSIS